jgi:hypothetical protein
LKPSVDFGATGDEEGAGSEGTTFAEAERSAGVGVFVVEVGLTTEVTWVGSTAEGRGGSTWVMGAITSVAEGDEGVAMTGGALGGVAVLDESVEVELEESADAAGLEAPESVEVPADAELAGGVDDALAVGVGVRDFGSFVPSDLTSTVDVGIRTAGAAGVEEAVFGSIGVEEVGSDI